MRMSAHPCSLGSVLLPLAISFVFAWNLAAQTTHRDILASKYQAELDQIAEELPGVLGIQVIDLESGERFGTNGSFVFPTASAIKVAILVELFRQASEGQLDLSDRVVFTEDQQTRGGLLQYFRAGSSTMSLYDLAVLMVMISDNAATNLIIDAVGMESVEGTMRAMGLSQIRLQRKMNQPDRDQQRALGNENLSTPLDAAMLMERIYRCDLPMGASDCQGVRSMLEIPHEGLIREVIPPGNPVAEKTGTNSGARTSWGYVDLTGRPFAIAVMGNYGVRESLNDAIRDVASTSYNYFFRLAGATEHGIR